MGWKEWIPVVFIGIGILIMAVNIVQYIKLYRHLTEIQLSSSICSKVMLAVYILLLFFFLFGYVAIEITFFVPFVEINNFLVGLIFFFGSVFVLFGILLQISLSKTIQKTNLEVARALVLAIEARDQNLNGHSLHVARLTALIYENLPKKIQRNVQPVMLEYAALLHDIGKLGVPEIILNKETSLSDTEWEEMKKHPLIGKNILKSLECFTEISDWVLYHHERWDGKGYLGLSEDQIPFPSRIISVADTYSAITTTRSYRQARGYEEAAAILKDCKGTQLDRDLVDLFLQIPKEKVEACWVNYPSSFS